MLDHRRPIRDTLLPFARPLISEAAIAEVVATLRSGWIVTGPRTARFESALAEYVGSPHAIGTNSCTAAMHLALLAAGVGPGDEVITTPLTFVATANAICHAGATPVFADVDRAAQTIDPQRIVEAITPRTKVILPMHMAGRPCDMDAISAIAAEHGLLVVEDAAHGLGAEVNGHKVGSLSDATCFSFHATKVLTTGEGGMVMTPHREWAERIAVHREHGLASPAWQRPGDHDGVVATELGFKYNMSDVQAALGLDSVARIDADRARREVIWQAYDDQLAGLPLSTPPPPSAGTVHARHLYTVMLDLEQIGQSRAWVRRALRAEGIGTSVHFRPVTQQPLYRDRPRYRAESFPNAEWISTHTLSLPIYTQMTDDDVGDVIAAVRKVIRLAEAT